MHYVLRKVFLRYFMVPLVALMVMISSFAMDPVDNLANRYTACSGLLISTILFHTNSLMKATAHSAKMSYFDMTMVLIYAANCVTLEVNILLFLVSRRQGKQSLEPISAADDMVTSGPTVSDTHGYRKYVKALNLTAFWCVVIGTAVGILGIVYGQNSLWGLFFLLVGTPACLYITHIAFKHFLPSSAAKHPPWWLLKFRRLVWRARRIYLQCMGKPAAALSDGGDVSIPMLSFADADWLDAGEQTSLNYDIHSPHVDSDANMLDSDANLEHASPRRTQHSRQGGDVDMF
mmetsp:Transcript_32208/g.38980  ORF Transcript_32208/g.38980 Transcript_32208/m.38980 type:complete len:290 (-) Transcript_32208:634-1503(-)